MHLLFLDESGTVPPPDKIKDKYFVIGGVIIDEKDWHDINRNFISIKNKYGLSIDSEIKWRYFSPTNKDASNNLIFLDQNQKYALREELYALITSYESVKIIYSLADIREIYKLTPITNQDNFYGYTYSLVIAKFKIYLNNLSNKANGIVIIDNRLPTDDKKLRTFHNEFLYALKKISHINKNIGIESSLASNNLIEEVFIAPSDHSMGIQFADIVIGAVYRKYEKNDDKCFSRIQKSILSEKSEIIKFP